MTTDNTKDLIHQYVEEVWNHGDIAAIEDLTTQNFTYHLGGQPGRDRAEMCQFIKMVHVAFPDWRVYIIDIFAEGNRVVVRWNGHVTHQGLFHGIPPTGKQITVCGINIYTVEDGEVAEEWEHMDSLGMLQQLGILPQPQE